MKHIHLAAVLVIVSTVASGKDVSCDLVGDSQTFRFIRENAKAILISNPNSVNLLPVSMWCGGTTCVSLEGEGPYNDGRLIINGPARTYDLVTQGLGRPTYSIWLRGVSDVEEVERIDVSCTE